MGERVVISGEVGDKPEEAREVPAETFGRKRGAVGRPATAQEERGDGAGGTSP